MTARMDVDFWSARMAFLGKLARADAIGVVLEVEQQPTRDLPQPHWRQVRRCAPEVSREVAQEERPVAPFEAELVVVHEPDGAQAGHLSEARPRGTGRARARPGCSRS